MATVLLNGTTYDSADLANGGHRDPDRGFFAILNAMVEDLQASDTVNNLLPGAAGGFIRSNGAEWVRVTDVDIVGTLSVTGAATFGSNATIADGFFLSWGTAGDTGFSGNAASDVIQIVTAGAERGRFAGGIFAWGTTVTAGAGAGEIVIGQMAEIRYVDAAGTGTLSLAYGGGGNVHFGANTPSTVHVGFGAGAVVLAGGTGGPVQIGDPATVAGAVAGEMVLANTKALRSVNPAGTDTRPLISLSNADRLVLGGSGVIAIIHHYAAPIPAEAINNGAIIVDSATPGQLVFYANGARYKLTGTAF